MSTGFEKSVEIITEFLDEQNQSLMGSVVNEMQARISKLEAVLREYADEDNWEHSGMLKLPAHDLWLHHGNGWERAQEALKQEGE